MIAPIPPTETKSANKTRNHPVRAKYKPASCFRLPRNQDDVASKSCYFQKDRTRTDQIQPASLPPGQTSRRLVFDRIFCLVCRRIFPVPAERQRVTQAVSHSSHQSVQDSPARLKVQKAECQAVRIPGASIGQTAMESGCEGFDSCGSSTGGSGASSFNARSHAFPSRSRASLHGALCDGFSDKSGASISGSENFGILAVRSLSRLHFQRRTDCNRLQPVFPALALQVLQPEDPVS